MSTPNPVDFVLGALAGDENLAKSFKTVFAQPLVYDEQAKCSPTLTECPRCKNDMLKCDGMFGQRITQAVENGKDPILAALAAAYERRVVADRRQQEFLTEVDRRRDEFRYGRRGTDMAPDPLDGGRS